MELPFTLESDLEREIAADPEWQRGVVWGVPRTGHLEGAIMYHIVDVLANIDSQHLPSQEYTQLRLVALVHDTFKYQVDESRPRVGSNHHAYLARKFAERYIDNSAILTLIELHDEVYNCWRMGNYRHWWDRAEERLNRLLQRLGSAEIAPYAHFFYADSATESKNPAPVEWFRQELVRRHIDIPQY